MTTDSDGPLRAGALRWTLDVPAGGQASLRTLRLGESTPTDLLRLAVVACAAASTKGPPLVCATDSDQLPVAATAEQRPVVPAENGFSWRVAGGALLLGAAVGGFAILRRRHRWADAPVARRPA